MDLSGRYKSISVMEVSITTFANEGYSVKYDFDRRVLCWRDYYMWNNNFTRCINDEVYQTIEDTLPELRLIEWMEAFNSGKSGLGGEKFVFPGEWEIKVIFNDKSVLMSSAQQHFPGIWGGLKSLIEKSAGNSFSLR